MKKLIFSFVIALALSFGQQANAQSILGKIFGGGNKNNTTTSAESTTSSSSTSTSSASNTSASTTDPTGGLLGGILNQVIGQATEEQSGSVLGNIIASVTGNATTTQASLIGTWTYKEPAVQFTSENLLTQAGGAAAAAKVEKKLVTYYKMVGITEGRVQFTFDNANNVTYSLGNRTFQGTYVFDASDKTVTITSTNTGLSVKAYVTISGNQMSLCFDSTKVLSLFSSVSKSFGATVGSLSNNYSGMKTGFKFTK